MRTNKLLSLLNEYSAGHRLPNSFHWLFLSGGALNVAFLAYDPKYHRQIFRFSGCFLFIHA